MRTLILLSAIPGSGKSTWARKYQKEHQNTYIVASDGYESEEGMVKLKASAPSDLQIRLSKEVTVALSNANDVMQKAQQQGNKDSINQVANNTTFEKGY